MRSISVIGFGYVGLPVAVAFRRIALTIWFDIDIQRLRQQRAGIDHTGEVLKEELK
jgi:UDP-N-acetyl-D-glucosamine/UDP-N-acetyl-D-galactosamine dehydrogenase